jgi:curved DNA-binding protein
MRDYYAILEVAPTATLAEIKRSYRRLARQHHPDLKREALDTHIKLLNEAYGVLSNPEKRARYDEQRREEERRATLRRKREQARREAEMTWFEGFAGFVKELKKGLQDES